MKLTHSETSARQTSTSIAMMKSATELQEEVRRRAYELYEQRGSTEGHELGDWLQAESEVAQKKTGNAQRTDHEHGAHLR